MSDKQRAAFEKWWVENCDEYNLTTKLLCWQAWQAAIASVVVELPESYGIGEVYLPAMLKALDEAGIKYE